MKNNTNWCKEAESLCDGFGPEDGIDPRILNRGQSRKVCHHKTLQLCKEAKRVLSLVLAGEMDDPHLHILEVIEVSAEGDGQFLTVTVRCSDAYVDEKAIIDFIKIKNSLNQIRGYLRSTITQSVQRKRVPALKFSVVKLKEKGEYSCLFKK